MKHSLLSLSIVGFSLLTISASKSLAQSYKPRQLNYGQQLDIYLSSRAYEESTQRFLAKSFLLINLVKAFKAGDQVTVARLSGTDSRLGGFRPAGQRALNYERFVERINKKFSDSPNAKDVLLDLGLNGIGAFAGPVGAIGAAGGKKFFDYLNLTKDPKGILYSFGMAQEFLDIQFADDPEAFEVLNQFALAELNFNLWNLDLTRTAPLQEFRQMELSYSIKDDTGKILVDTSLLKEKSDALSLQVTNATSMLKKGQDRLESRASAAKDEAAEDIDSLESLVEMENQATRDLIEAIEKSKAKAFNDKALKEKSRNEIRGGFGLAATLATIVGDEQNARRLNTMSQMAEQAFVLSDGGLGPLATVNVYASLATGLVSLTQNVGPSEHDIVMGAFKNLFEAIQQLSEQMHSRFDSVDSDLAKIYRQMNYRFDRLDIGMNALLSKVHEIDGRLLTLQRQMHRDKLATIDSLAHENETLCFKKLDESVVEDTLQFIEKCLDSYSEFSAHKSTMDSLGVRVMSASDFSLDRIHSPYHHLADIYQELSAEGLDSSFVFQPESEESCLASTGGTHGFNFSSLDNLSLYPVWVENADKSVGLLSRYPQHVTKHVFGYVEPIYCHGQAILQAQQQLLFFPSGELKAENIEGLISEYVGSLISLVELIDQHSEGSGGFKANQGLDQSFVPNMSEAPSKVFGSSIDVSKGRISLCSSWDKKLTHISNPTLWEDDKRKKRSYRAQVSILTPRNRVDNRTNDKSEMAREIFFFKDIFYSQLENWQKWALRMISTSADDSVNSMNPRICVDSFRLRDFTSENKLGEKPKGQGNPSVLSTRYRFLSRVDLQFSFGAHPDLDVGADGKLDYSLARFERDYDLISVSQGDPSKYDSHPSMPLVSSKGAGMKDAFRKCSFRGTNCPGKRTMQKLWSGSEVKWSWQDGSQRGEHKTPLPDVFVPQDLLSHQSGSQRFGKMVTAGMSPEYKAAVTKFLKANFVVKIDRDVKKKLLSLVETSQGDEKSLSRQILGQVKLLKALAKLGLKEGSDEQTLLLELMDSDHHGLPTAESLIETAIEKDLSGEELLGFTGERIQPVVAAWGTVLEKENPSLLLPQPNELLGRLKTIKSFIDRSQADLEGAQSTPEPSCGISSFESLRNCL